MELIERAEAAQAAIEDALSAAKTELECRKNAVREAMHMDDDGEWERLYRLQEEKQCEVSGLRMAHEAAKNAVDNLYRAFGEPTRYFL